ncbi:hypothetical protein ABIE00_000269 [Arthrobacter sp. OAP107]
MTAPAHDDKRDVETFVVPGHPQVRPRAPCRRTRGQVTKDNDIDRVLPGADGRAPPMAGAQNDEITCSGVELSEALPPP